MKYKFKICDFCKKKVSKSNSFKVKTPDNKKLDICEDCFSLNLNKNKDKTRYVYRIVVYSERARTGIDRADFVEREEDINDHLEWLKSIYKEEENKYYIEIEIYQYKGLKK